MDLVYSEESLAFVKPLFASQTVLRSSVFAQENPFLLWFCLGNVLQQRFETCAAWTNAQNSGYQWFFWISIDRLNLSSVLKIDCGSWKQRKYKYEYENHYHFNDNLKNTFWASHFYTAYAETWYEEWMQQAIRAHNGLTLLRGFQI